MCPWKLGKIREWKQEISGTNERVGSFTGINEAVKLIKCRWSWNVEYGEYKLKRRAEQDDWITVKTALTKFNAKNGRLTDQHIF